MVCSNEATKDRSHTVAAGATAYRILKASVAIDGDDSTLFRSLHPEQIIPAVPVTADSRIELSVKPCEGGGGLSASNLLFKHLDKPPSVDCSADQEFETWLPLGKFWHKIFRNKMAHLHTTIYQPACIHTLCCSY